MHSLSQPIYEINSNLDSLRDFVDVLDSHLTEKLKESFSTHSTTLEFMLVVIDKILQDNELFKEEFKLDSLPEEKMIELRAKYPEISLAEITRNGNRSNIKIKGQDPNRPDLTSNIDADKVHVAINEINRAQRRTQMLYSSSLMTLTSSVEIFFAKLFHQYFCLHPESIGAKEKLFSFDDLSKFDTLSDARTHYINSKIEDLLRGSLSDWFLFARNNLKLQMGYLKEDQELLEETFQRRNLVVHNGGIANSIYMAKVPEKLRKGVKNDDNLTPNRKYLSEHIDLWEKNCILIAAELWKQIDPEDSDRVRVLGDISYKHLLAKRWSIAASISTFIMRDKQMPESSITSAQLNYWQCQKRLDKWSEIYAEVKAADYSAKSLCYQLAHLALLEKSDEFYSLLPRAIQSEEITENDLREYPIFIDMRKDPRFESYQEKQVEKKTKRRKKSVKEYSQIAPLLTQDA